MLVVEYYRGQIHINLDTIDPINPSYLMQNGIAATLTLQIFEFKLGSNRNPISQKLRFDTLGSNDIGPS